MRTKLISGFAALVVVVAGSIAFFIVTRDDTDNDRPPLPKARDVSRSPVVCAAIGTDDPGGTTISDAAWQALLDIAGGDKINAQRLPIPATTSADAEPYLNGLVARQCRVVVATGPAVTSAARAVAARYGDVRWAVADSGQPTAQLVVLSADPATVRTQVAELAQGLVR
jgi:basic membrane lipoprotein Med (substrate-binding protein (PBP1-ABC) superfamily)